MAGSGSVHLREVDDTVLRVEHLTVEFPIGTSGAKVHAVSDVSLDVRSGETVGIVGESGCGKSTTGKAIMRVPPPTGGRVLLRGVDLATLDATALRTVRGQLQMIFQDPISSLNPRRTIRDIVAEPLTVQWLESFPRSIVSRTWSRFVAIMMKLWHHRITRILTQVGLGVFFVGFLVYIAASATGEVDQVGRRDGGGAATVGNWLMAGGGLALAPVAAMVAVTSVIWLALVVLMPFANVARWLKIRSQRDRVNAEFDEKVEAALTEVGIDPELAMPKYPHEFSGGQAQRISIARALILEPEVIICDEPVSALDVSVQAQVLNLLEDLKAKHGISLIFIAHDLAVVKNISDQVVVMYLGKTCEVGQPDELFVAPRHPYTQVLMSAIPVPDPLLDPRSAVSIEGELPSPINPPSGCRFRTRCPRADDTCARLEPQMTEVAANHFVACHHPLDESDWGQPVMLEGQEVALT